MFRRSSNVNVFKSLWTTLKGTYYLKRRQSHWKQWFVQHFLLKWSVEFLFEFLQEKLGFNLDSIINTFIFKCRQMDNSLKSYGSWICRSSLHRIQTDLNFQEFYVMQQPSAYIQILEWNDFEIPGYTRTFSYRKSFWQNFVFQHDVFWGFAFSVEAL